MSSSVFVKNRGADHRANSGASYAADRLRQAQQRCKIRIRVWRLINSVKLSHRRAVLSLVAKKSTRKRQTASFVRFFAVFCFVLVLTCVFSRAGKASAADSGARRAVDINLATRLASDFRVSLVEKPLREALVAIADAGKVNLWLDRQADPTTPISTDASASTIYLALVSAAKSANLDVCVVENVALVGRAGWVEQTAAAIRELPKLSDLKAVSWPELTTPPEAFLACGAEIDAASRWAKMLPHDLWPATRWTDMPSEVACLLVTAQFDQMPPSTTEAANTTVGLDPLRTLPQSAALYPSGKHASMLRSMLLAQDRNATVKEFKGQLLVVASPAGHRVATHAWLQTPSGNAVAAIDVDKVRFTLRLQNAAAEQVLRQLATTAGRTLSIQPVVAEVCKQPVSLSVEDETMRELAQRIADAVGVQVSWTDADLRVSSRP